MVIRGFIEEEKLEEIVYKKIRELGITKSDYPIDPYQLAKEEGIILQEMQIDDVNIRGMLVHGPNATGILINSNRCYVSKRFIAMHELCHHWFHPHRTKTVCFENYKTNKKGAEWQANNAAAIALMPADIMKEIYQYCNGDINYICKELKVSEDSVKYRIEKLGLIVPKTYEYQNYNIDNRFIALENTWLYGGI